MDGLRMTVSLEGFPKLQSRLKATAAFGRDMSPLMRDIGFLGENSTKARFEKGIGPDGITWLPSMRAKREGGQTLVKSAHLRKSISSEHTRHSATWGTNKPYAAIHQFGGTIERYAFSTMIRLRVDPNGSLLRQKEGSNLAVFASKRHKRAKDYKVTVGEYKINMPARPYLGLNAEDDRQIALLAEDWFMSPWSLKKGGRVDRRD